MKEKLGILSIIFNILSFFLIPYIDNFWLISLFLTMIFSLLVVLFFDRWYKYLYPIFALSWFVIVMRICWAIEFMEVKELFLCFSWIGCAMWCIGLALKIAFSK